MGDITISLIAAVAGNNVIGADNDMPWRLSTDLKRFKAVTMGKPIIMGRRTFESVGKALPGRLNVVVTRNQSLKLEGAVLSNSLDDAIIIAKVEAFKTGQDELMITGGGQIYASAMEYADRLYITHVDATPNGDTYFPKIDEEEWKIVFEEEVPRGEKDNAATIYRIYERKVA
ncbi:MAG: dihydrofolate reductase [Hyphomicrobiales bacterium]